MRKYAVVFVHGLAKKPSPEKLEEIWRWGLERRTGCGLARPGQQDDRRDRDADNGHSHSHSHDPDQHRAPPRIVFPKQPVDSTGV